MYQALPYKARHTTNLFPTPLNDLASSSLSAQTVVKLGENINMKSLVEENAVIIFGLHGCCMTHVVWRLLLGLGVNPAVHEVDQQDELFVIDELKKVWSNCGTDFPMSFPTVFIGGRWFGNLDRVMATHIIGELTPVLKDAGALWL